MVREIGQKDGELEFGGCEEERQRLWVASCTCISRVGIGFWSILKWSVLAAGLTIDGRKVSNMDLASNKVTELIAEFENLASGGCPLSWPSKWSNYEKIC